MTETIKAWAWWVNTLARRTLILAQSIGVCLLALLLAMAFETREPPLTVFPQPAFDVRPGEWAELRIPVRRDLSRNCGARFERILIDVDGSRFPIPGGEETAEGIREIDRQSPGELKIMVLIPPARFGTQAGIDPGPAVLRTTRVYWCNPLQEIFPIRSQSSTLLNVLP